MRKYYCMYLDFKFNYSHLSNGKILQNKKLFIMSSFKDIIKKIDDFGNYVLNEYHKQLKAKNVDKRIIVKLFEAIDDLKKIRRPKLNYGLKNRHSVAISLK